jgi:O-antigen ligase
MSRHPAGSNLDPGQSPALIRDVNGHSVDVSVSVDNAYLKYGLAIGVVGVALMMLVLIGILVTARRAARSDSSDALPAALFGAVTTMIVVSATVATFTWEQAGVLFSIIVGMVMAYAVYPGSESERDDVVASG